MGRNFFLLPLKNNMNFGNFGFFFPKKFRFEYCYFFFFKKLLKLMIIKSKFNFCRNFWYYLKSNLSLFKKSKNSRMGSGMGLFLRYVAYLSSYFIFFEMLILQDSTVFKLLYVLRRVFFFNVSYFCVN